MLCKRVWRLKLKIRSGTILINQSSPLSLLSDRFIKVDTWQKLRRCDLLSIDLML
jgi:hypothetical protein